MQTNPVSTAEVVALRSLGRSIDQTFVDWAVAMLTEGHDTPGLRVLAGELPPFNQFEMQALVDRVFRESGIELHPTPFAASRALATVRVNQALAGERAAAEVTTELSQLHIELDYPSDLQDFYLLHNAVTDLQSAEVQWYWPDMDRNNMWAVVDEAFKAWLRGARDLGVRRTTETAQGDDMVTRRVRRATSLRERVGAGLLAGSLPPAVAPSCA